MALKRPAPFTVNDRSRYDQIGLLSIFAHEKHCSRSNKKTQNSSPDVWKGKKIHLKTDTENWHIFFLLLNVQVYDCKVDDINF